MQDCLIIGGGPAGLMAAVYLARYRRTVTVVDAGKPRAGWIPASHNCPGFPGGIAGAEYLAKLADQARDAGAKIEKGEVREVTRTEEDGEGFQADGRPSRLILLATGAPDNWPDFPGAEQAVRSGLMRFCPICDGPEAAGKRVLLLFGERDAAGHARFLRGYTRHLTLVPASPQALGALERGGLPPDVEIIPSTPLALAAEGAGIRLETVSGTRQFDVLYPMLGNRPAISMLEGLRPKLGSTGGLVTDPHQETSIAGIYAAGDVVEALDQIAVAVGQAAIAAAAMHRRLSPRWA